MRLSPPSNVARPGGFRARETNRHAAHCSGRAARRKAGRRPPPAGRGLNAPEEVAMADVSDRRNAMVDYQIVARGVRDARVLDAMREVPRERFVPGALAEFAYEDTPLPIEAGQTIRSEEHTSELQSLMRISYAVFCLKKKIEKNETMQKE